jgi:hypothetical protein
LKSQGWEGRLGGALMDFLIDKVMQEADITNSYCVESSWVDVLNFLVTALSSISETKVDYKIN